MRNLLGTLLVGVGALACVGGVALLVYVRPSPHGLLEALVAVPVMAIGACVVAIGVLLLPVAKRGWVKGGAWVVLAAAVAALSWIAVLVASPRP